MIRILQTTGVVALIAAGVVFGFCITQWRSGGSMTEMNTQPSIVEKFKQRGGENKKGTQQNLPPLVKQAKAFASYLDPPEPPEPVRAKETKTSPAPRSVAKVSLPKTTPKFTLLATSAPETTRCAGSASASPPSLR